MALTARTPDPASLAAASTLQLSRARRGGRRFDGWTLAALAVSTVVALPVLTVLGFLAVPPGGTWAHLVETVLARYVGNTLLLLAGVAVGTAVGGVATAWLVTMCRFPGRRHFEWLLILPLAMPAYVLAYTYTGLLDVGGPVQAALREAFGWSARDYWFPHVRSLPGAIAMFVLVLYPYVYMLARAAFLEQSVCVLEASRTLGCSALSSFFRVALPLARPAIAAGLALALMETLNDFGTVEFFAVDTFTTGIFRTWFGLRQPEAAAHLGAVLLLFVVALLLLERASRGRGRVHHTTGRYRALPAYRLSGTAALAASVFCALPVVLGFLLPAAVLLRWAMLTAPEVMDGRFWRFALNSLVLASLSALLCAAIALLLAYAQRGRPTWAVLAATRTASLGYAIPGAVIAVGVLLPAAAFDNALDAWMRARFDMSTGLLLTGGIGLLTFAYVVRFLAVAFGAAESGLAKVTPNMDAAARTLGAGPGGLLRRVHVPMLRGSLLVGLLLVFVDVMKELPATLLLRPFNFDTLAIRAHQYAAEERLMEAAGPGLAIVAVGILPVILLCRAIRRARPGSPGG